MNMNLASCGPSSSELNSSYVLAGIFSAGGSFDVPSKFVSSVRTVWGRFVAPTFQVRGIHFLAPDETETSTGQVDTGLALTSQLVEYLILPDDWDGYDGKAASLATVMDAFEFLRRYPSTLPKPKPMISGSGVIGLYWEGNDCYASIDFDGSGYYCYIADRPGDEEGEDRVPVSNPLPQRLIEVIAETAD